MNDEQDHGLLGSLMNWVQHPFNSNGSVENWAWFIGLILVLVWMWNWILLKLTEEI